MRRIAAMLLLAVLVVLGPPLHGAAERVAVSDFLVHSDNPSYRYMGKGISEMIAVELQKAKGVELVERQKRTELLKEMEIALSDIADSRMQIEVGRLLAARYFVFGEIVDMGKEVLISLRMTEVESGQVVWSEKLVDRLSRYEYIAGFFTRSILSHLKLEAGKTTVAKVKAQEEKKEEAVVAFSKAIDLYDRKETREARKELQLARRIDPKNEAVRVYVLKLETVSPKYRVELEKYVPAHNPASLSLLESDKFYSWSSSTAFSRWSPTNIPDLGDGFSGYETTMSGNLGYMRPLGKALGVAVEYVGSRFTQKLETPAPAPADFFAPTAGNHGACLSIGYAVTPKLSLGLSGLVYVTGETWEEEDDDPTYRDVYAAVDFGLLGVFLDGRLILDLQLIYTTQKQRYFDRESMQIVEGQSYPLIIDNTLTASFLDTRLFVTLKGIEELYFDTRGGYALRAIPIIEYFPLESLSFRAGYEYGHLRQFGRVSSGHGALVGISGRIGRFELFLNYAYRNKVLRIIPGYSLPEHSILAGFVYNAGFVTR